MKIVAIEGGISAGKSTLLPALAIHMTAKTGSDWSIIKEPVDENPEFHRLLKQFIANPTDANKRAEFQMFITRTRHALLQGIEDGNYLIERSLYSDIVFTQANMLSTEGPTGEYQASYYDIKEHFKTYPRIDVVVYLDRNPAACLASMRQRDRSGEGDGYTLEYFEDLNNFHLACLPQVTRTYGAKFFSHKLGNRFADARILSEEIVQTL